MVFALLPAAGVVTACGVMGVARMTLPLELVAAEQFSIQGLGTRPSGSVHAGEFSGDFHRRATRLALFDASFERDSAVAGFSLRSSTDSSTVDGRCDMRRQTVSRGALSFEPKPMAYVCVFSVGTQMRAQLSLHEQRDVAISGRRQRRGSLQIDDLQLQVRSIHALVGTPLTTAAPIGYVIERDSRGIGAVEINGTEPVVVIARDIAPRERTAVWLVALATALLWDPAQAP